MFRNGKKVTVTKTTVSNGDGTSKTEVQETIVDEGGNRKNNTYVEGLPQARNHSSSIVSSFDIKLNSSF